MINANELRIGNWFQQDASNNNTISRFFTVDEIKRYGVRSTYIRQDTNQPHTSLFSLDSIHPIPLTPEILEKCGFRESKKQPVHFINLENPAKQLELLKSGEYFYPAIYQAAEVSSENDAMVYINRIQHLHQLQNLYFALTGEELNYTP